MASSKLYSASKRPNVTIFTILVMLFTFLGKTQGYCKFFIVLCKKLMNVYACEYVVGI